MPRLNITRRIDAPQATVFQVASDLRNAPGRIKNIRKLEVLTDGPIRKGTRFRETRVCFGREATEEMEILEFDPPRRYDVGCESCGCRYHSTLLFRPAGGGTDVEFTFEAQPLTLFARIMGILMAPMFKKVMGECAKDIDDLKSAIESESSAPSAGPAAAPA
jgi:hypothetical protein